MGLTFFVSSRREKYSSTPSASFRLHQDFGRQAGQALWRRYFSQSFEPNNKINNNICPFSGGYIALTSVIIISLLLITITAALSVANYFSRFNILENEFKIRSDNLAEACVSYARAKLIADPNNYAGNELSVPVGVDTCSIISVTPTGGSWPKTIKTQGIYPRNQAQASYTNLLVVLNGGYSINSWQESPN